MDHRQRQPNLRHRTPRRFLIESLENRQLLTGSTPFNAQPFGVGKTIPAVQYDKGGAGVAYFDTTVANRGLDTYRNGDAVDIQKGGAFGHVIAYAVATEWLNYTVTIPTAGQYIFDANVSNIGAGGLFHLAMGTTNLTGAMAVPNTGNWLKDATVASARFTLPAGTVVLRLVLDQNASSTAVANFDTFQLVAVPPVKTGSTPFTGVPFGVGKTIPAVQYDKGGSGIAYYDTTAANRGSDTYRNGDAVDIQKGGSFGHVISYAVATEWLNYTVTIPTAGQYVFDASVSNIGPGGSFHLAMGTVNLTGAMAAPNTGDWLKYATVASAPFSLPAGTYVLRVALDQNASSTAVANFDTFKIVSAPVVTPPPDPGHVAEAILTSASPTAQSGVYLRIADGAVLADVNGEQQFEPASNIKTLLAVTALQAVQAGSASLSETITYYYDPNDPTNLTPNPESFADTPANALTATLQDAIAGMLQNSDNRMTYALELRFGLPAINATAALIGMSSTTWSQTVGNMVPGNYTTLADADLLYDKVLDGSVLNPTYSSLFQTLMLNQTNFGLLRFLPVMHQEAAGILGVAVGSSAEINLTNTFSAGVFWGSKAGTYYLPINSTSMYDVRSHTGYLILPTRVNGVTTYIDYTYGEFLVNAVIPTTSASAETAALNNIENALLSANQELVRGIIHSAMLTYVAAG